MKGEGKGGKGGVQGCIDAADAYYEGYKIVVVGRDGGGDGATAGVLGMPVGEGWSGAVAGAPALLVRNGSLLNDI